MNVVYTQRAEIGDQNLGGFHPDSTFRPSLARRAGSSCRQSRRVDLHAGGMMAGSRW